MRTICKVSNTVKYCAKALIGAGIVLVASSSFAAKPTSIKFIEDVVVGNSIYSHYVVVCSNKKRKDISAWNNRKSWCVGKGTKNNCKKNQLSAARKVCGGKKPR